MKAKTVFSWAVRILPAAILLQTLFFKFTAAPESVYIFSQLGMEPWGRIGTGVAELLASILLLIPPTAALGALAAAALMVGAIGSHLFVLGIEVQGDGGTLFILAILVLLSSVYVLYTKRASLLLLLYRKRA